LRTFDAREPTPTVLVFAFNIVAKSAHSPLHVFDHGKYDELTLEFLRNVAIASIYTNGEARMVTELRHKTRVMRFSIAKGLIILWQNFP
jgi:hypothetical protein